MPSNIARGAIPVELPVIHPATPESLSAAKDALNALLALGKDSFTDGAHHYSVIAHASEADALAHSGDWLRKNTDYEGSSNTLWLTIQAPDAPTMATNTAISGALHANSLTSFLATCEGKTETFDDLMQRPDALKDVLLQTVMYEARMYAAYDLPDEPNEEDYNLAEGGRGYAKSYKDTDPVIAIIDENEPFTIANQLDEQQVDYIGSQDADTVEQATKTWTEDEKEDVLPAIEALGLSIDDAEERLREFAHELLMERGGSTTFTPSGTFAISMAPTINKEKAYITFDGISSSSFNAVIDDSYLQMLDLMNIDPKAWVQKLAEDAGMPKPNLEVDLLDLLKQNTEDNPHVAGAYGIQWTAATNDNIKEALVQAIFFEGADDNTKDTFSEEANYLFDIALEILKSQAEGFDFKWLHDNGVDTEKLQAITSTRVQMATFPQMENFPNYHTGLSNLGSNGATYYDWKNPPDKHAGTPLIDMSDLRSILDNANYSGTLCIAFECDYEQLLAMGKAIHEGKGEQIVIKNAYLHIQDYMNGAGDGEALQEPIKIDTTDFLKNWDVRNDAVSNYGINETFGQFLATSSRIKIEDPANETAKRAEAEQSALSLG